MVNLAVVVVVLYRHLYVGSRQTKSFALLHKSARGSHSACRFKSVVVVVVVVVDIVVVDIVVASGVVVVSVAVVIVVLYRHLYSGSTQTKSFAMLHKSARGSHSACRFKSVVVAVVDVSVTVVEKVVVVSASVVDDAVVDVIVVDVLAVESKKVNSNVSVDH